MDLFECAVFIVRFIGFVLRLGVAFGRRVCGPNCFASRKRRLPRTTSTALIATYLIDGNDGILLGDGFSWWLERMSNDSWPVVSEPRDSATEA